MYVFKFYVAPIILSRYWNFHQSKQTCDLAGAGVNQAAGQIWPAGRQLAIAGLENEGASTSHNPMGLHGLLEG
jgi:hypothetical protein